MHGIFAVQALGQNPGNRGLAHTARPCQQIGMVQTAFVQCVAQGFDNVFLTDQIGKGFRTPFSCKNLISHVVSLREINRKAV